MCIENTGDVKRSTDLVGTVLRCTNLNSMSVFLALLYMYGPGSRDLFAPRYDFMSIPLLILGIGSFVFHASLRQNLQFVDDLSMILLGSSMLHGIFTVRQSPSQRRMTSTVLAVCVASFSAFYVWSGEIIYHVLAFATQIILIALRGLYLYNRGQPRFPEAKVRSWSRRQWEAIFICLFGYLLWNIDLEFCAELRSFREQMGLPWAWFLELHGWWHILTAIGADRYMKVVRDIHDEEQNEKAK